MIDINSLVDLVVATAKVDTTAPDSTNLRNGWRTDALLQDIDAFMIGSRNDPAAYAEIGRQVLKKVRDLPEMAALAQLAIIRGERLLPVTPGREKFIVAIIQNTEKTIAALPGTTKKMRCKSLFEYHVGIFYDTYGRFDLAAKAQRRAALEAERFGDRPGAAISYFMETVSNLKDALRTDKPTIMLFREMEKRFAKLVEGVRGSSLESQWAEGNGPTWMIETCIWLNQTHSDWDEWVKTTLAAVDKLGKAWQPIAEFVRAVNMASYDFPEADDTLHIISRGTDANERKATALLVLVRRALRAGKVDEAKEIVKQMPEQEAQHVRAIAERLLSKI